MSRRDWWFTNEERSRYEQDNRYFVGKEVEHNRHFGKLTLFVVGLADSKEIVRTARHNGCEHIFFGANYSNTVGVDTKWRDMIREACEYLPATIDLPMTEQSLQSVIDTGCDRIDNLDIQFRITVPNIEQFTQNAKFMFKIDDQKPRTNPGVWVGSMNNLVSHGFTDWDQYRDDFRVTAV